ncbi:hypothetical protein SLA2020_225300 [Shorea laevis]
MEKKSCSHVLLVPYPTQGHINPMLQFSRRLASKGLKTTLAVTNFIFTTIKPQSSTVQIATISDGFDQGGFTEAQSAHDYLARFESAGSKTLADLITKHKNSPHPIDCVVYDSFLPWALDVAHQLGLVGAAFFTQNCAVNYIYYNVHHGLLTLPISPSVPSSIPGLPLLELRDMPSFIYVSGSYPAYFEMVLLQFSNTEKADFVLVNTFYELEQEVVDTMSKVGPLLTIGPTIPSAYLDKRIDDDTFYGLDLFKLESSAATAKWLSNKPPGSVVYVSFGSLSNLSIQQMEEMAWGLKNSGFYFLWVVRDTEKAKIPAEAEGKKGLIVGWCPQMEVLSNAAVGCFFTHCGWNSTIEALSLGVPMVAMPQWTDQPTDAKFVEDVWKVGVRVRVEEDGIVRREEIECCIREVVEGERGKEMKENAKKWKELSVKAVCEGGSSDKNIDDFVSRLINT